MKQMANADQWKQKRVRIEHGVGITSQALMNDVKNLGIIIVFMTSQQTDSSQNISREQAVIAYTKGSAYAEFAEKYKGALIPGMLADLAVLSQDIFTIPAQQLPGNKSVLTIIYGKIVYQQDY